MSHSIHLTIPKEVKEDGWVLGKGYKMLDPGIHLAYEDVAVTPRSDRRPPSPSMESVLEEAYYITRTEIWDLYHGTYTTPSGQSKPVLIHITSTCQFPRYRPPNPPDFISSRERFSSRQLPSVARKEARFIQKYCHDSLEGMIPSYIGFYKAILPEPYSWGCEINRMFVMILGDPGDPVERLVLPLGCLKIDTGSWTRIYELYDRFHSLDICLNVNFHCANIFYDKTTDRYRLVNLWAAFRLNDESDKRWSKECMEKLFRKERDNIAFFKQLNRERIMSGEPDSN
ncbi:hypothetical protein I302_106640 [Kwoniella bestiolae CBS 10118]|uniref:Uncharacterized protein n=1 Tax=Kwoniella bestiolae CBS 10118 TaxID=1296100 RepID=A0A1B9G0T6_9TREE|nr:hypothetical protein I302_06098 [Kwoniella bestiolae CBS 10118]OCF24637.1 hypothetical protein I302_06098 [Kwoniella bestiolae CBS 10118]